MKQMLTLMFLAAIGGTSAQAQIPASACGDLNREVEYRDIECLVTELVKTSFPELKDALAEGRISVKKFCSEDEFVRSKGDVIEINPAMVRTFLPVLPRPTLKAVQGILAHELVHVMDFEESGALARAKTAVKRVIDPSESERSVDERAFERGYAEGIALFRQWTYTRLGQPEQTEALERNKKRFYTPEEIQQWIMENDLARPVH